MPQSAYEREREANIARNKALLDGLGLGDLIQSPARPSKALPAKKPKPIQPANRVKREREAPVRQSMRLRTAHIDPNETPKNKRKREAEEIERVALEAERRIEAEERTRRAKRPRHDVLDLQILLEAGEAEDPSTLNALFGEILDRPHPREYADPDDFVSDEDGRDVQDLKERLGNLKIVARAKVTEDRVYSAAYHPEKTKDLVFIGDKHGQLGIWDARAPTEESADDAGDIAPEEGEEKEGGKYWRLQLHWPATSKSSISCVKFDPTDSHNVYTSSYDCTIRKLSFETGVSEEMFTTDEILTSSFDFTPDGHEMWISDAAGGVTHLDLRESKAKARIFTLSTTKIGSVSVNPVNPRFILTASNDRTLKIWDVRKLGVLASSAAEEATRSTRKSPKKTIGEILPPAEFGYEVVEEFRESKKGKGCLRGEWRHDKSVSSAYWDPRGRAVVSTSYDDSLRLWDLAPSRFDGNDPLKSFRPLHQIKHNCRTGKWLTVLRAQWSPNPNVYPHFTIGNMKHSLDIFSCKGDLLARLYDPRRVSAVQAVTCSHPNIVERAVSGNGSGRCVLWAPGDEDEDEE